MGRLVGRRTFLALVAATGGAGLASACTTRPRSSVVPPAPDPDLAALQAARDAERGLLEGFAAWFQQVPAAERSYGWLRDAHEQHLAALDATGLPAASPSAAIVIFAGAADLERDAQRSAAALAAAAEAAVSGEHAALLASISAFHALPSPLPVDR